MNMKHYDGMLPKPLKPGHIGYYPVSNKREWEELPDLYKVMEWRPVKDYRSMDMTTGKPQLRAVKSVIFHVAFMEPYGISGKFHAHPSDVLKLLFCNYGHPDCQLYSISAVELEGGTRLGAKWYQDTTTGAFGVFVGSTLVGIQGGFSGHIPDCITREADGTFKHNWFRSEDKVLHYTLTNPFEVSFKYRAQYDAEPEHQPLAEQLQSAVSQATASRTDCVSKDNTPERI